MINFKVTTSELRLLIFALDRARVGAKDWGDLRDKLIAEYGRRMAVENRKHNPEYIDAHGVDIKAVFCDACLADPGQPCRYASGGVAMQPHSARYKRARA